METVVKRSGRIDLHVHSTASDGTMPPAQIVETAADLGLSAIAFTDHDTMEGLPEALEAGKRLGVEVVRGVEISLEYEGPKVQGRTGWMHLLVYDLDPGGVLAGELSALKRWRAARNDRIIEKLRSMNIDITLAEVAAVSGKGQIGRPHFARVLLDKGVVASIQEAFQNYLGRGAPAYEDKRRLSPQEALGMARGDGAIPVLAHPFSLGLSDDDLRIRLSHWQSMGLAGIEVIYPDHVSDYRERLTRIARGLGLTVTGGTDFHGANKPDIKLASGINGNVEVFRETLDALRTAR